MPNPIFFHLPEAKRQRLMDAIWAEFTTVPYMEVSINRIIQAAGISRGSFYQYFSGKQDVFAHLLNSLMDTVRKMFLAQMTAHNNDLFDAVLGMYDMIVWTKQKARTNLELDRLETILRLNIKLDMSQFTEFLQQNDLEVATMEQLNRSGYVVNTPQEAAAILRMICSIGLSNISNHLRCNTQEETTRQMMEYQLNIIRRGLEAHPSIRSSL